MESTDLYALVDRDRTDHLVELLELKGVHDRDIEIQPAPPGRYQLHDERFYEEGVSARRGGILGVLGGLAVGLIIAGVFPAIDGLRDVIVTMAVFAGFGGVVGGLAGVQRAEPLDGDPVRYTEVTSDDDLALVAVHDEHLNRPAHKVLHDYGVAFIQEPTPV
jgi:hypothetical protein